MKDEHTLDAALSAAAAELTAAVERCVARAGEEGCGVRELKELTALLRELQQLRRSGGEDGETLIRVELAGDTADWAE